MNKRGRELDANESHAILIETEKKNSLVSWFQPFTDSMIDAIKTRKKSVILDGQKFLVYPCKNGTDYIFRSMHGFLPMTRLSLENLESRVFSNADS